MVGRICIIVGIIDIAAGIIVNKQRDIIVGMIVLVCIVRIMHIIIVGIIAMTVGIIVGIRS